MHYQYAPKPATIERLISGIVLVGIAVALAALMAVIGAQNTKAASDLDYFRDGALMDALIATQLMESDEYLNLPTDARRDAARILIDEDSRLLVDPAASVAEEFQILDSAWIQFVEDNMLLPSAASTSSFARYDTADRIAAMALKDASDANAAPGNDVIDLTLGYEFYFGGAVDTADRIAALGTDVIDLSVGYTPDRGAGTEVEGSEDEQLGHINEYWKSRSR